MGFSPQPPYGFCANCGASRTSPSAYFCPNCGSALAAMVPPPAAAPPPPPAPPAPSPQYAPPFYGAVPPQPAARKGASPLLLLAGLAIVALVAGGLWFFLQGSSGGITFAPSTIDCSKPAAFVSTIRLPASVKATDTLTEKFDGKTVNTFTVADDNTITKQPDGSWTGTSTTTADQMAAGCASGGLADNGADVFSPGAHTMQVLDATRKVLAQGSYTVTGVASAKTATPTVKATPTPATGSVTFSPRTFDCATPSGLVVTLRLPASVKATDTLTQKFDGKTTGTITIADDSTIVQQPDGSWLSTSTSTADQMVEDCAAGGVNSSGIAVLTPGTHTMQVLDGAGEVLAQGSYTVTGVAATPTRAPTPAPTPAALAGKVVFSTDDPTTTATSSCKVAHQVTSVSATTSVYATYVFGATAGDNVISLSITFNGKSYLAATDIPMSDTSGYDCYLDSTDLSTLSGWSPGAYHFSLMSDGDLIGEGDLVVK